LTPLELEQYLHRHIPLTQAMQLRVAAAGPDCVVLTAPLAPNINHRETAFGGSISALATLAAWSLVYVRMQRLGLPARVVIHRNTMEYRRPITGAFAARAALTDEQAWEHFAEMFRRRGKARIVVHAQVVQLADDESTAAGDEAGVFVGEFVALGGNLRPPRDTANAPIQGDVRVTGAEGS